MGMQPVGSPGWSARMLRGLLNDVEAALGDAAAAGVQEPPTGQRAVIREYLVRSNEELLWAVLDVHQDTTQRLIRAALDIAKSIIRILDSEDPGPVSALILDRALGEAAMRLCFIHEPGIAPARSLVRMALYQLESIEGNLRTAEAFRGDGLDEAARARENIAEMHARLTAGGFEIGPGRREPYSGWLRLDGETESASFNATDAYQRYLKVGSWQWAIGSGATHGLGWLLPNVVGTVDEDPMSTPQETLLTVVLSTIEVADALVRTAGGYTGTDVDPHLKRIHQRRLGVSAALGIPTGYAIHHSEYGDRTVAPRFPHGTGGASFAGS